MLFTIDKLATNDPAERHSCVREENRILAANGVDISHMQPDDIYKLIKETGSSITLKVEHPNGKLYVTVTNTGIKYLLYRTWTKTVKYPDLKPLESKFKYQINTCI